MTTFLADTARFYDILARLEDKVGGRRMLGECDGRMDWPQRGVYFFFEAGETRSASGHGDRVVRVGTQRTMTYGLRGAEDFKQLVAFQPS